MNKHLLNCMNEHTPKLSPHINGTATEVLAKLPDTLNNMFMEAMTMLESSVNLTYQGYRRATPYEEYRFGLSKASRTVIELAKSYLYLVYYEFAYEGQKLIKPLFLPYAELGNLVMFSGTMYTLSMVLSDKVFSPTDTGIFTRLLISKINTTGTSKNFVKDDVKIPGNLIHSADIARVKVETSNDKIGKPVSPIALYLLAKYGLKRTFEKYAKVKNNQVIITGNDDFKGENPEDWHVYKSTKERPRSHRDLTYIGHDVKVLVHKSVKITPFIENVIFSIIYSYDMLPELGKSIDGIMKSVIEEKAFWLYLLGRLTYKDSFSIGRIVSDMESHLQVLKGYLDKSTKKLLKDSYPDTENFFDLLSILLGNYNKMVVSSKESNNVENKYLDIDYYISYDIVYSFHKTLLTINRRSSKTNDVIKYAEIVKMMSELSPKKIYLLVKSRSTNLALSVADYSADLIYPKATSILENQNRGFGVNRGTNVQFPPSIKFLQGQDLLIGSLLYLNKKAPTPLLRINAFADFDVDVGSFKFSKEDLATAAEVDRMISGGLDEETAKDLEELTMTNDDASDVASI